MRDSVAALHYLVGGGVTYDVRRSGGREHWGLKRVHEMWGVSEIQDNAHTGWHTQGGTHEPQAECCW